MLLESRRLRWRREKAALLAENRSLNRKATAVTKLQDAGTISSQQVRRLETGINHHWTAEEVGVAVGLRCISRKAYLYLQRVMHYPLPSISTLSLRTRGFRLTEGVIEGAKDVLAVAVQGMSARDRLCVICFDEVSLNGRWCYDQMTDRALAASKMQLLMVRGLCAAWKQPFYYDLDAPMTVETIHHVIVELETAGLTVVAAVSDMGPGNEKMWRQAGISGEKTYIPFPTDPERYSHCNVYSLLHIIGGFVFCCFGKLDLLDQKVIFQVI